ncbi:transglutaminase-like domain-containing protein [Salipiger sp.]|uniref:transglutaminase-like domain-containing protein n=1 Tax=Salipiger sp. TaxID=2078585 RepID=UPI003A978E30
MRIKLGCRIGYTLAAPTPMVALLNVHYSRFADLEGPDHLHTSPGVPVTSYRDMFGNWCARCIAPAGEFEISTNCIIRDSGEPDPYVPDAMQHAVEDLPSETLTCLLGSRYCDTDLLSETAWNLFENTPPGWERVQAICDYVHNTVQFGYEHARNTRTASQTLTERVGVCRDFTHLAITFCRCMNIPARYCTGYLGDIGIPLPHAPGDFAAWMEVYLGGAWWTFDPRNNQRRIGRVLIAQGRDAADVPLTNTFGRADLTRFEVWTDEIA